MVGIFIVIIVLLIVVIAVLLLSAFQKVEPNEDITVMRRTINNLKNEIASQKYSNKQLVVSNDKMKAEVNAAKLAVVRVNEHIHSIEVDLKGKERELERKTVLLSNSNKLVDSLSLEKANLEESLSNATNKVSNLKELLTKETKSKEYYAAEMDAKQKSIDDLKIENADFLVTINKMGKKMDAKDQAIARLNKQCDEVSTALKLKESQIEQFENIISSKNPFDYVAHLRAHALEHSKEYEKMNVEALTSLFKYQYKFEYLLSIYPELKVYRNDDAYLQYMQEEEERCNIKNWLVDNEYEKLSETEREQLAVDRYIDNFNYKWTNWEKGRNYEIYVAYMLYNAGYDIIQEGLNKKLEDKGRDIIATHRKNGRILIVQCKNWSEHSMIRENVIFQLYGSYMQWLVDNSKTLSDDVVPCLYYTCQLSPVAKECAKMLKVECVYMPIGRFPAIKCNINKNTKEAIYHLPFDRHYDLVKINAKGKGYMFEISKAIEAGFRRAYNH